MYELKGQSDTLDEAYSGSSAAPQISDRTGSTMGYQSTIAALILPVVL